ncbi:MAG: hypothetical protein GXO43_03530 [Crenarchaeota archaeon]|nr:hypothetical protein [Thermoproteota archaeon]
MRKELVGAVVVFSLALMLISLGAVFSSPPSWAKPGAFMEYRLTGTVEANPPTKDLPPKYSAYSIVRFEIISYNSTMAEGRFSVLENNDTKHIFKSFMGYEGMETTGYIRWDENFTISFPPLYLSPEKLPKDGHMRQQRIITGNTTVTLQLNDAWYDTSTGVLLHANYIIDTNVTGGEQTGRYLTKITFQLIGSNFVPGYIKNYTVTTTTSQPSPTQVSPSPTATTTQSNGSTYYAAAGILGIVLVGLAIYYVAGKGRGKKR